MHISTRDHPAGEVKVPSTRREIARTMTWSPMVETSARAKAPGITIDETMVIPIAKQTKTGRRFKLAASPRREWKDPRAFASEIKIEPHRTKPSGPP